MKRARIIAVALAFGGCDRDVVSVVEMLDGGPCVPDPRAQDSVGQHTFRCPRTGWTETAVLKSAIPDETYALGRTIALENNILVAADTWETSPSTGWRLSRFVRDGGGWRLASALDGEDVRSTATAVTALAVSNGHTIVGASDESGGGAAFVFDVRMGITSVGRVDPGALDVDDEFGAAVDISGGRIVVGAPGADGCRSSTDNACPNAGVVYVFDVTADGPVLRHEVRAPEPRIDGRFGGSVALVADRLVVGAPGDCRPHRLDCELEPAAYVFFFEGDTWAPKQTLESANPYDHQFGGAVAWAGSTAVVGAPTSYRCVNALAECGGNENSAGTGDCPPGKVRCSSVGTTYLFTPEATVWSAKELRLPTLSFGAVWGTSIAATDDQLLIGAPGDASCSTEWNAGETLANCVSAGAVHRYVRLGEQEWERSDFIKARNLDIYDRFGSAVAIGTDRIIVGAMREGSCDDLRFNRCSSAGAIYVYEDL